MPRTQGAQVGAFVELHDDKPPTDISALGLGWVRIMYDLLPDGNSLHTRDDVRFDGLLIFG